MGLIVPKGWPGKDNLTAARTLIRLLNEYFFQTHEGIGNTNFEGHELQYFSPFHRFWERNHRVIIDAIIDRSQAKIAAKSLSEAVKKYGDSILRVTHETHGLPPTAIAQVRFFTANQDFRQPPEDPYKNYKKDPRRFDAAAIAADPARFLQVLGATRLSQTDKRLDFARNAAGFLLDGQIPAYDVASRYHNDAGSIKDVLTQIPNAGYGAKKANMFVRDMVELGVWPHLRNTETIDVASDINTMKLALRTRILRTEIPLISSFLDVFSHQYAYVDEASAQAWRAVWEEWKKLDTETAPRFPGQMDFLLYRIGREYCLQNLVKYECPQGHTFYHFGAGLRNCRVCALEAQRSRATPVAKLLPCQVHSKELPRVGGVVSLPEGNLLRTFNGVCILEGTCMPKSSVFHTFDPPKSISIKGQTGWTNSYAWKERGGGGMMG